MATSMSTDNPYRMGYTVVSNGEVINLKRYPLKVLQSVIDISEIYIVKDGDTLTRIAEERYSNPREWWVIADYNNIVEPWNLSGVSTLIIPPLEVAKKNIVK